MLTILENIDSYINDYLDGRIENPLLKKVIIDEIAISNNLIEIIRKYLLNIVITGNITKLNIIIEIINILQLKPVKELFSKAIRKAFVLLSHEEQIFLILNINDINNIFFKSLNRTKEIRVLCNNLLKSNNHLGTI